MKPRERYKELSGRQQRSIVQQMEHWGYYLLPKPHPHSPGYTGLLVAIREKPTEMHFDPEIMRLQICYEDSAVQRVTLGLETPVRFRRVCPGQVILLDRLEKRVDFFTFGGTLDYASVPGERVYSLRSPAPILELTGREDTLADHLAVETEAMIGELHARWGEDDVEFGCRLARVDPLQFYVGSIHSMLLRYEQNPALKNNFSEFYAMLLREQKWLAQTGRWSEHPPTLEDLLTPDSEADLLPIL